MLTLRPLSRGRNGAPGDHRGWIVSAALFAPLVLLLIAAIGTWRAEARYARVTERVIHDYAAIAAWQYVRRANVALHNEAMGALKGIAMGHRRTSEADPVLSPEAILTNRSASDPLFLREARFAFSYDGNTQRLETAGENVDEATRAMLKRRLLALAQTIDADTEPHRVLFDSSSGAALAIAIWTVARPDRPMRAAYGVAVDSDVLAPRLRELINSAGLLPVTAGKIKHSNDDIAVRLTRRDNGVVFATALPLGSTTATDTTGLQNGELLTSVDLSPQLADALLVGGAPGSQLPALGLMIVVAAVLAALGLVQQSRSRELARLRGRFVANVSHELRTPLAQISMFAETLMLRRERSPSEGRDFTGIIFTEARRLTGLVESVLRFSRIESGRETLRLETLDLAEEISEAAAAFAPIANAAEATIELRIGDEVLAPVDRGAFRQVMLNLLDNAVKHGGRGGTVGISLARDDGHVRVMIDDSGPGVPREWRQRVFEPFVRIEHGSVPGAGIGLAVVRELVVAHGGTVAIEESPQGGARLVVTLPAASEAPVPPPAPQPVEVLT